MLFDVESRIVEHSPGEQSVWTFVGRQLHPEKSRGTLGHRIILRSYCHAQCLAADEGCRSRGERLPALCERP
jgi:hypothetical protein